MSRTRIKDDDSLKSSLLGNEADSAANEEFLVEYEEAKDATRFRLKTKSSDSKMKSWAHSKNKSPLKDREAAGVELQDSRDKFRILSPTPVESEHPSQSKENTVPDFLIASEEKPNAEAKAEPNEMQANAAPEAELPYEVHNVLLYYSILLYFAPAALFGVGTFGWYCFFQAALGIEILTAVMADDKDSDKENLKQYATIIKWVGAWISLYGEVLNGSTQFSIAKIAEQVDTALKDVTYWRLPFAFCAALCENPVYVIYATIFWSLFSMGTIGTSWGSLDEVYVSWMAVLGEILGPIIIDTLFAGAVAYVLFSFASRTASGIRTWYDSPTNDIRERLQNHGNLLIEMQYLLENFITTLVRTGSLSFLFGGLAEKVESLNMSKTVGHMIGGTGGAGQGLSFFWRGTFRKYHEHVSRSLIQTLNEEKNAEIARLNERRSSVRKWQPVPLPSPVTQQERREALSAHYTQVGYCGRLFEEMKRPFCIGLGNVGFSYYATKVWLGNSIVDLIFSHPSESRDAANAVTTSLAVIAALLGYSLYYMADEYRKGNRLAIEKRIHDEKNPPLPPEIEISANAVLHISPDEEKGFSLHNQTDIDMAVEIVRACMSNLRTQFAASQYPEALHTLEADQTEIRALGYGDYYDQLHTVITKRITMANQPGHPAATDEESWNDLIAAWLGITASLSMVSTRVFVLTSNMVHNEDIGPLLSMRDWAAICVYCGIVVGDNRYYNLTPESIKSIKEIGKSVISSYHTVSNFIGGVARFCGFFREAPLAPQSEAPQAVHRQQPPMRP